MNMQGALRARLLAAVPVTTLVGQRVSWVDRPKTAGLPAVTLQVVSEERPQHMKGFDGLRSSRVQVDVWADTYGQTKEIAEAVTAAIVPSQAADGITFERAFFAGSRDLGEQTETQFIHRTSIDFIVHHSAQ